MEAYLHRMDSSSHIRILSGRLASHKPALANGDLVHFGDSRRILPTSKTADEPDMGIFFNFDAAGLCDSFFANRGAMVVMAHGSYSSSDLFNC